MYTYNKNKTFKYISLYVNITMYTLISRHRRLVFKPTNTY